MECLGQFGSGLGTIRTTAVKDIEEHDTEFELSRVGVVQDEEYTTKKD